jgi:hypothetical protein
LEQKHGSRSKVGKVRRIPTGDHDDIILRGPGRGFKHIHDIEPRAPSRDGGQRAAWVGRLPALPGKAVRIIDAHVEVDVIARGGIGHVGRGGDSDPRLRGTADGRADRRQGRLPETPWRLLALHGPRRVCGCVKPIIAVLLPCGSQMYRVSAQGEGGLASRTRTTASRGMAVPRPTPHVDPLLTRGRPRPAPCALGAAGRRSSPPCPYWVVPATHRDGEAKRIPMVRMAANH